MNYRCYHFNNAYLAGIHGGIQSAHAQTELAIKYVIDDDRAPHSLACESPKSRVIARDQYIEWACNHKTMIVLNGGMMSQLLDLERFLQSSDHPYAWAAFREEEAALNNALTNIAVVLPERIYANAALLGGVALNPPATAVGLSNGGTMCIDPSSGDTWIYQASPTDTPVKYTNFEVELMTRLSRCRLM